MVIFELSIVAYGGAGGGGGFNCSATQQKSKNFFLTLHAHLFLRIMNKSITF